MNPGYRQRRGRIELGADRADVCVEIGPTDSKRMRAILRKAMDSVSEAERIVNEMADDEVYSFLNSRVENLKKEVAS